MATDLHHEAGGDDAAHEHHAFDPEPIRELPPDEPQTPLWLPALGLALFVILGIYMALGGDEAPAEEVSRGVAATAEALPKAPPAAAPTAPPRPGAGGPTALDQLSPEQRRALEERIRNVRERQQGARPGIAPSPGGAPGRPAPPPARDPHEGHGH